MPNSASLVLGQDLTVAADYGQIYVYSVVLDALGSDSDADEDNPYLQALADAVESRRFVGVIPGLVDVKTPSQFNWRTPVRLEVWTSEPPADTETWDHEVDVDLSIPDGRLWFEPSGGSGPAVQVDVPPGEYRLRVSGRGFTEAAELGREGPDAYRVQLWISGEGQPPVLRASWPGWDNYR